MDDTVEESNVSTCLTIKAMKSSTWSSKGPNWTISLVDAPCPVHDLQNEIRNKTGYLNLYHELEFFGTCPKCAA